MSVGHRVNCIVSSQSITNNLSITQPFTFLLSIHPVFINDTRNSTILGKQLDEAFLDHQTFIGEAIGEVEGSFMDGASNNPSSSY